MCGIVGQLALVDSINLLDKVNELEKMMLSMKHRGPDEDGKFCDRKLIMGMRRLSILDLSSGKQPLYNEDHTVSVVFNGEIYNYIEIKNLLLSLGHDFYTSSDTEVLVHLYEEYGDNFSEHINGMFAYALWDCKKSKLILSRDRVGEKPLFYAIENGVLYFASEMKSILLCEGFTKEVDLQALNDLYSFNYVPYPNTAFKNIKRLEPGSTIVIQDARINRFKYWEIPKEAFEDAKEDITDIVKDLILDATKIRLRSDVEVGAFLSGGIDSTLVVKNMRQILHSGYKTFSIGFEEEAFNELGYSKHASEVYGTEHIYKVVRHEDFFQELIDTIWYCENPHGDVSFTPTYILANLASGYLKVALTGDGGDEVFGGYDKYLNYKYDDTKDADENFEQYFEEISVFNRVAKEKLFSPILKSVDRTDSFNLIKEKYIGIHPDDFLNKILYFDADYLLEGNNLVKPDRMGMAHSIEARYPLLDYRIINLLFRTSSMHKIVNGDKKHILKELLKTDFDQSFINRKKQMFTVPIGEWFKTGYFKDIMYTIFNSETFQKRSYYNNEHIMDMLNQHVEGSANYTREIRLILIVELWHRIFIDNDYNVKPSVSEILGI